MDEVASKAMNAMKTAKATLKGFSGVFKQATQEHGALTVPLVRVKLASDVRLRRELFPKLRSELLSHEAREGRVLYPVWERYAELRGRAHHHELEAEQLERMLDQLQALPCDHALWRTQFAVLADFVCDHVENEENEYFPIANRLIGQDEAERMAGRYAPIRPV